jgi:hypothetical protein
MDLPLIVKRTIAFPPQITVLEYLPSRPLTRIIHESQPRSWDSLPNVL